LTLDGHGSHVTIEALEQAVELRLDMVTLFAHTLHVLQPFNVTCFKLANNVFKKMKIVLWQKKNYIEPNKITLTKWVDKALQQFLKKDNLKLGFNGQIPHTLNPNLSCSHGWKVWSM
jgi:hypothetical protein